MLAGDQRGGEEWGVGLSPDFLFATSLQAVWYSPPKVRTPVTQNSAQSTFHLQVE